jgi:hypothetical protein
MEGHGNGDQLPTNQSIAAAEGKVRELKEAEANARRSLEQLTASSQLKQTTEPAVVDVYQHTRYETSEFFFAWDFPLPMLLCSLIRQFLQMSRVWPWSRPRTRARA